MARASGRSPSAAGRVGRAFGLNPHRADAFNLSTDPSVVAEVREVAGLDLPPPASAAVRCADGTPQVRAVAGTRPVRPMARARAARATRGYTRPGTTPRFAAPSAATGAVTGGRHRRPRHREFVESLDPLSGTPPGEPAVPAHVVPDHRATHKTAAVERWLPRHPEDHRPVIPTRRSRLNPVGRFVARATEPRLRRGVSTSAPQLGLAIAGDRTERNKDPSRSCGPPTPTPSSNASRGFVNGLLTRNARFELSPKTDRST